MFIGLYCLASTADAYLSPALEYITVKFGISESLAGVTLLAFGNGAPDVFSSISAVGGEDADAVKSVCILFGGTVFITCVVVALSTNASKEDKKITVTPRFFLRDIFFFLITCIYLLFALLVIQEINIFVSVGLLVLYAIYVILVVIQSK
jgi:sodium/potassium/calcium exchanger 6